MVTSTADDGDDREPRSVDDRRSALLRTATTPALTGLAEQLRNPFRSLFQEVNNSLARAASAQLEPVLRSARVQASMNESFQPLIDQQQGIRKLLEPVFAQQVSGYQQQWAQALLAPLMANTQLQERMSSILVTPELTAAMQRIGEVAWVSVELPDTDGIDRVSELIESGEIDATTLEAAEAGVGSEQDMTTAIDEAAEVLRRDRPRLSRQRARQVVIVLVWLAWTATLVGIAVATPPIVGTVAGAAGLIGSKDVAQKAGVEFDKRFPPKGKSAEE